MWGSGLRSRLFQAIGVVVLLCVALTIGLGVVLTKRAVKQAAVRDVGHQADLIVSELQDGVFTVNNLQARIGSALNKQHEHVVYDPHDLPLWAQKQLAHGKPAQGTMDFGGDPSYFAARKANPGTLILLRSQSTISPLLSPYVLGLLIAAAAGGLLAALAAFLLARRISRPVDRIAAAARTLTGGVHPEPVPVEGASEIATLAVAFNELASQLRRAQEAERNFLLSVSHELKTPLTAIRGYAEAVEDGAVDAREAAATVASEARRLERLVKDLLDLARMNRTDFGVTNTEIDLTEVVEDAVRRYEQQAAAFGVELHTVADGPAPAVADADRVLQVVSNLVENALRLTPAGGEVRVVAAPGLLRVEDTGPGLAEDDTEHAFERFYLHERYGLERRVGTGLGLAIVKELTLAMGGTVEVESRPGTLTVFTVRLGVPKVASRETLPA
ncbi:MAG TPA: HAMP domain-containing sensor histidine kinase [Gaiellaceae bacterium]|jgi:two-component system, OmpR family, sensor kinase|nr:HAMP domain-containing sensor histidine kinase [Gaiellaceae bacterium]